MRKAKKKLISVFDIWLFITVKKVTTWKLSSGYKLSGKHSFCVDVVLKTKL